MKHSPPSEADSCSHSPEIPYHYYAHKGPPPVPILSHMKPIHTLPPNFLKIHLSLGLLSSLQP